MKITWLDNHRYNVPEDVSFMINELDEQKAEIDRLTLALRDSQIAREALRKNLDEATTFIEQATGKIEVTKVRIIKQAETISFLDCENDQLRAVLRNIMEMTEAKTTTAVEPVNTTAIHALACRALKEVNNDR